MIILTDRCFDAIALSSDDTLVLMRAGGVLGEFVGGVTEIPDPLLLGLWIEINQGDLFRRRQKRHRAARLHMKAKMAMLAARDVSAEESGGLRIVKIRQRLRFDVFHRAVGQHSFELALRDIRTLSHLSAKLLQRLGCSRLRARRGCRAADLLVSI